jgi:hypothetical protein
VVKIRETGRTGYQRHVIARLRELYPEAIIIKGDANFLQGIPDLLVLWNDRWAALECKMNQASDRQPNQDFYIELMDQWSFAAFIWPDNEEAVLGALQSALLPSR